MKNRAGRHSADRRKPAYPHPVAGVFDRLEASELTAPDAVEQLRQLRPAPCGALESAVVNDPRPYIRLVAAWTSGALGSMRRPGRLISAYRREPDPNVRSNIVWALVRCRPKAISRRVFRKLLDDPCRHVALVALRSLAWRIELYQRIEFLPVYRATRDRLRKLELLRAVGAFRHRPAEVSRELTAELFAAADDVVIVGLLEALAVLGETDALLDYFESRRHRFASPVLARQFARCCTLLCESRPHRQLAELYRGHRDENVRWQIVEALAAAGGPYCAASLAEVVAGEAEGSSLGVLAAAALAGLEVTGPESGPGYG